MGLEVFVVWYRDGKEVAVAFSNVHAAFGAAASAPHEGRFRVAYGSEGEAYVYAAPDAGGMVESIMIEKPCRAPQLWESIVAVMRLGHGLCSWPGDAQAVANAESVAHVPDDAVEGMEPQVVQNGAQLVGLVESS